MVRPCSRPASIECWQGALLRITQTPLVSSLGKRGGHSDNGKFCRRLGRPQGRKVSERSLFALQNSATSKLNTSFDAYLMLRLIVTVGRMVGQAGTLVIVRIGVISDTHGLLRPEAEQRLAGVEHIVHAGDIGRPDIITGLRQIAPVIAIRGNVDTGHWAERYPDTKMVRLGGRSIYVLHDIMNSSWIPYPAELTWSFPATRIGRGSRLFTVCSILIREAPGQGDLTCPSLSRHWS
jgi:Calcineurin-like phosphoesterase superfamily domain